MASCFMVSYNPFAYIMRRVVDDVGGRGVNPPPLRRLRRSVCCVGIHHLCSQGNFFIFRVIFRRCADRYVLIMANIDSAV